MVNEVPMIPVLHLMVNATSRRLVMTLPSSLGQIKLSRPVGVAAAEEAVLEEVELKPAEAEMPELELERVELELELVPLRPPTTVAKVIPGASVRLLLSILL